MFLEKMGCYSAIKKARAGGDGPQETESNSKLDLVAVKIKNAAKLDGSGEGGS